MRVVGFVFCICMTVLASLPLLAATTLPQKLSDLHLFSDLQNLTPAPNVLGYEVNFPLWSDGAKKKRWIYLPPNSKIEFRADSPWGLPQGSVLIKQFDFELKTETRIAFNTATGWQLASYLWTSDQTDAVRVDQETNVEVKSEASPLRFNWSIPSPNQCMTCHLANGPDGEVRGFNTQQFGQNQLRSWISQHHFSNPPPDTSGLTFLPEIRAGQTAPRVAKLARGYLEVNCASCHRYGGFVPTDLDFSWATPDTDMNAFGRPPLFGNLGVPGAQIISPGVKEKSVVWLRMNAADATHMPYLGSKIADPLGLDAVGNWIDSFAR